jgi:hypothetical protein
MLGCYAYRVSACRRKAGRENGSTIAGILGGEGVGLGFLGFLLAAEVAAEEEVVLEGLHVLTEDGGALLGVGEDGVHFFDHRGVF